MCARKEMMDMKKWTALLLASAIALSLTACGSGESTESPGSASTGTEDIGTAVESKGLFVLDRSSGIDLSQEENLSERETYLIHVYDIIPDDAKNVDMSQFNSDYTVLLNGVNTYESSTTYGGTALNSFLLGSGYQLDREIGTVFAGDDAIRAVSAFRINANDVSDTMTAEFKIEGSDLYNCDITLEAGEIQTIHYFDEIFALEENPRSHQLAGTIYARAKAVNNGLNYFSNHGGISDGSAVLTSTVTVLSAASYEVSCSLNGSGALVLYDFNSGDTANSVEADQEALANAVAEVFPELAESAKILLEQGKLWVEQTELCANSETVTQEMQQNAYSSGVALGTAANTIIEYFEQA